MDIGYGTICQPMLIVVQGDQWSWDICNVAIIAEAKRSGMTKVLMMVDVPQRMMTPEGPKFLGTDAAFWDELITAGLELYYIYKHVMFQFKGSGTIAPFYQH